MADRVGELQECDQCCRRDRDEQTGVAGEESINDERRLTTVNDQQQIPEGSGGRRCPDCHETDVLADRKGGPGGTLRFQPSVARRGHAAPTRSRPSWIACAVPRTVCRRPGAGAAERGDLSLSGPDKGHDGPHARRLCMDHRSPVESALACGGRRHRAPCRSCRARRSNS